MKRSLIELATASAAIVALHGCAAAAPIRLWSPAPHEGDTCDPQVAGCKPTKEQVLKSMAEITPAVSKCLGGYDGILIACVEFAHDGLVVAAGKHREEGCVHFETGPLADAREACVKHALLRARLPPFQAGRTRVHYPFKGSR